MTAPNTPPGGRTASQSHEGSPSHFTTSAASLWLIVGSFAVLAGCGGGTKTVIQQAPQTQTVVQDAPETVTQTVPANTPATSESAASTSSGARVPDLVGERLDVAEDDLDAQSIRYREVGGGTFGIVVKSNWTVCETSPRAGQRADGPVRLVVDREC